MCHTVYPKQPGVKLIPKISPKYFFNVKCACVRVVYILGGKPSRACAVPYYARSGPSPLRLHGTGSQFLPATVHSSTGAGSQPTACAAHDTTATGHAPPLDRERNPRTGHTPHGYRHGHRPTFASSTGTATHQHDNLAYCAATDRHTPTGGCKVISCQGRSTPATSSTTATGNRKRATHRAKERRECYRWHLNPAHMRHCEHWRVMAEPVGMAVSRTGGGFERVEGVG